MRLGHNFAVGSFSALLSQCCGLMWYRPEIIGLVRVDQGRIQDLVPVTGWHEQYSNFSGHIQFQWICHISEADWQTLILTFKIAAAWGVGSHVMMWLWLCPRDNGYYVIIILFVWVEYEVCCFKIWLDWLKCERFFVCVCAVTVMSAKFIVTAKKILVGLLIYPLCSVRTCSV